MLSNLKSNEISPRAALLSLAIFTAVLITGGVLVYRFVNQPPPRRGGPSSQTATSGRREVTPPESASGTATAKVAKTSEYDPLNVIVGRNLFAPPGNKSDEPPAPETAPPTNDPPFTPLPGPVNPPSRPPDTRPRMPERQPVVFTGVAGSTTKTYALLEDVATSETRFVAVGEEAFGCCLVTIEPDYVVVDRGGALHTLALGEKPETTTKTAPGTPTAPGVTPAPGEATPGTFPAVRPPGENSPPTPRFGGGRTRIPRTRNETTQER